MKKYLSVVVNGFVFLCIIGCVTKVQNSVDTIVSEPEIIITTPTATPTSAPSILIVTAVPTPTKPELVVATASPVPQPAQLVITPEIYNKTFNDINILIKKINNIVDSKNYKEWLTCLTEEYIIAKSDSEYLQEISQLPTLKLKNIHLTSLEDYFFYVIIPSNTKADLEKILFIDNNHVKAYGTIYNKSGILYYFERVEEQWKIGVPKQ